MKTIYAAYEGDRIVGLYNSVDHKPNQIPQNSIILTVEQYNHIIARPNDFTVVGGRLRDSGISASLPGASSGFDMPKIKVSKWSSGFIYKGVCYWADDRSSEHITQCLAIASHDKEFKPTLKVTVDGEVDYMPVALKDLVVIAKGVNELRLEK
jgi:hypothetical protein